MSFDEYTKIIQSCSCIILGYKQQAATCNCLTSMWNGVKVVCLEESMNYKEYNQNEHLPVYSIEKDLSDELIQSEPDINIYGTRNQIEQIYSYRRWVVDLEDSLKIMKLV